MRFKMLSKSFSLIESGFTLIELLVVIAVIGVITAIGMASFSHAQQSARDTRRKSDLRAIQVALQLYKEDNGAYPGWGTCSNTGSDWPIEWGNSSYPSCARLTTQYMPLVPKDPSGIGTTTGTGPQEVYCAYTVSGQQQYTLFANLENPGDPDATAVKPKPVGGTTCISSSGCTTATINTGPGKACNGVTFNYWVNNP